MHPEIQRARDTLFDAIRDLTPDQADVAPGARWSVAGIVEHLSLTYSKSSAGMARRREKGPGVPARSRTLQQRVQQFVIVTLGYFPPGRESPTAVVPTGRPYRELLADKICQAIVEQRRGRGTDDAPVRTAAAGDPGPAAAVNP